MTLFVVHAELIPVSRFEYDSSSGKVTLLPLAAPFHDIAVSVMATHVMLLAGLDTPSRLMTLKINREGNDLLSICSIKY